jgi:hypothetical protein
LYSRKPSLLNLFMKKLTRDLVVPIIPAGPIANLTHGAVTTIALHGF